MTVGRTRTNDAEVIGFPIDEYEVSPACAALLTPGQLAGHLSPIFRWRKLIPAARLSATIKLVALLLAGHYPRIEIGFGALASEACLSRRAVISAIAELERLGFLTVERRELAPGRNLPNRYFLCWPAVVQPVHEVVHEDNDRSDSSAPSPVHTRHGGDARDVPEAAVDAEEAEEPSEVLAAYAASGGGWDDYMENGHLMVRPVLNGKAEPR